MDSYLLVAGQRANYPPNRKRCAGESREATRERYIESCWGAPSALDRNFGTQTPILLRSKPHALFVPTARAICERPAPSEAIVDINFLQLRLPSFFNKPPHAVPEPAVFFEPARK
jgi:hypothetical protein